MKTVQPQDRLGIQKVLGQVARFLHDMGGEFGLFFHFLPIYTDKSPGDLGGRWDDQAEFLPASISPLVQTRTIASEIEYNPFAASGAGMSHPKSISKILSSIPFATAALILLLSAACTPAAVTSSPTSLPKQPKGTATQSALVDRTSTPWLEGGSATTVSSPTAPAPVARVTYVQGGNIWLDEGEGTGRQLTQSGADDFPLFSPDGGQILYRHRLGGGEAGFDRYELRVVSLDGSYDRLVAGPDNLPGQNGLARLAENPTWAPDGNRLAFNTYLECGLCPIDDDLWLADLKTGAVRQVLPNGQGGQPDFSPDGRSLLVSRNGQIDILDADGKNRRTLFTFEPIQFIEGGFHPSPVWSNDGQSILLALPPVDLTRPVTEESQVTLWRVPLDGQPQKLATLAGADAFALQGQDAAAHWSPDRSRFGFTNLNRQVVIYDLLDGKANMYRQGVFLGWNPDGQRFLFDAQPEARGFWREGVSLGQLGSAPVLLLPADPMAAVTTVRWLDADTFVYFARLGPPPDGDGFELRLAALGGPSRVIFRSSDPYASKNVDVTR